MEKTLQQESNLTCVNRANEHINVDEYKGNLLITLNTLSQTISALEKTVVDNKNTIEDINKRILLIEEDQRKVRNQYSIINEARLAVIDEQKKALNALSLASIKYKIKQFLKPKIGCLYSYEPRPVKIPNKYLKTKPLSRTPLISIVTPAYNHAEFIERTMLSVLEQNYPALEYIVQDGGSTDDTRTILSSYSTKLKHWESKKDNGQSNAINLGFKHTNGEIMAYLNSDDILLPGTLNYVANYFNNNPDVDVVYGHRILIDEYDFEVGRWVLPQHDDEVLTWADYIPQETLFWRRSIWDKAGSTIDESFKFAMDWDLLLRFKEAGSKMVRLPRFLGSFRIHPHQKTSSAMNEIGLKEMERLRIRCHGKKVSNHEITKNIRSYQLKHVVLHKAYRLGILRY